MPTLHIICEIVERSSQDGGGFEIVWRESGIPFEPYRVDRSTAEQFKEAAAQARKYLRTLSVQDRRGGVDPPDSETVRNLARAGRRLFDRLFLASDGTDREAEIVQ